MAERADREIRAPMIVLQRIVGEISLNGAEVALLVLASAGIKLSPHLL